MSNPVVRPYLNFEGRCEEALEFYRAHLGAEIVEMMRMKDSPEPCPDGSMPPETGNKVMHALFKIGESTLMASDCRCSGEAKFHGISLAYNPPDEAIAGRAFAALADGGEVCMPLGKTFWSPCFGVVNDRFGVTWMMNVEAPKP